MADQIRRARHRRLGRVPGSRRGRASREVPVEVLRRLDRVRVAPASSASPGGSERVVTEAVDPAPAPTDVRPRRAAWRDALGDRVPVSLRGATLAPGRSAVVGLALLLTSAVALAVLLVWLNRPRAIAAPPVQRWTPSSTPADAGGASSPGAGDTPGTVVVHVAGAVRRPGLVELPAGSRVDDAVTAAGGPTARADLGSVNLARPVVDGEQIVVLRRGQAAGGAVAPPVGGAGNPAPGQPVDLNTATLEQLDSLPGVGPVLAQRIVDWRAEHGRFSSVEELTEVSGIGDRTLAELRPLVRV